MRVVTGGKGKISALPAVILRAPPSLAALDRSDIVLRKRLAIVPEFVAQTGRALPNVSRLSQRLAGGRLLRLGLVGREVQPVPVAGNMRVDLLRGTHAAGTAQVCASLLTADQRRLLRSVSTPTGAKGE